MSKVQDYLRKRSAGHGYAPETVGGMLARTFLLIAFAMGAL